MTGAGPTVGVAGAVEAGRLGICGQQQRRRALALAALGDPAAQPRPQPAAAATRADHAAGGHGPAVIEIRATAYPSLWRPGSARGGTSCGWAIPVWPPRAGPSPNAAITRDSLETTSPITAMAPGSALRVANFAVGSADGRPERRRPSRPGQEGRHHSFWKQALVALPWQQCPRYESVN